MSGSASSSLCGDEFLRRLVTLMLDESNIVGDGRYLLENNDSLVDFKQPADLEVDKALS